MDKLTRADLMSLEQYSMERKAFREKVMAHKANRKIHIGSNATLYFEDRLTMLYQVQEMLRIEKIFESAGINEELEAYNPLIPDGSNWKATFMVEFSDVEERKVQLGRLIGIERKTWVQVAGFDKVYPIANEDLTRETEEKTSAVHFLRFELTPVMVASVREGAAIAMGIEHPNYTHTVTLSEASRASLAADLG
ncbi:MAG: DUF3501 family protein [Thiothrix litoralis]|uniref:DUF3501 family protein n=1 Tax=Thiothrix lacustris TaxID=525917 RepID=A0ABY9ML12_9GAMM|nr:DUF3501 family protein [Thiothrix lacustris]WML89369.1 DUF3501 family protein [Thiothrix lacustris]